MLPSLFRWSKNFLTFGDVGKGFYDYLHIWNCESLELDAKIEIEPFSTLCFSENYEYTILGTKENIIKILKIKGLN